MSSNHLIVGVFYRVLHFVQAGVTFGITLRFSSQFRQQLSGGLTVLNFLAVPRSLFLNGRSDLKKKF